jgi:hypothetical protein
MNDSSITRRRGFRFRLRTLLLLPAVFAVGWWWLTWPERTAKRFVELLDDGNVPAARAIVDGPPMSDGFWKIARSKRFNFASPTFQSASWSEFLTGQRTFNFEWQSKSADGDLGPFLAQRNRIMLSPSSNSTRYFVTYISRNGNASAIADRLAALYPDSDRHHIKAMANSNQVLIGASQNTHGEVTALMQLFEDTAGP